MNLISLFSGAGGLDLGFEKAGLGDSEEFKERYEDFCNAMDDLENLANELFGEMRSFTKEESDEYEAALDAMSEPTDINFCDELDIVNRRNRVW